MFEAGSEYSADEMMTVAVARMVRNGASCFVGIGLPSAAANLARLTHAPDTVLIYESGCIGTKPSNVNSTVIGDYDSPKTRLPGAGGCAGYRGQLRRGADHALADQTRLRREVGFPDLGRTSGRRGRPRSNAISRQAQRR